MEDVQGFTTWQETDVGEKQGSEIKAVCVTDGSPWQAATDHREFGEGTKREERMVCNKSNIWKIDEDFLKIAPQIAEWEQ